MSALADIVCDAAESLAGSPDDYDSLIQMVGEARFVLLGEATHGTHEFYRARAEINLRDNGRLAAQLRNEKLERAIGVIYRPETEMQSHYFHARLSDQFDAVLHFDHTRAVEPLERTTEWELGEVEETFPSGL